jgi:hypothetical protein
MTDNRKKKKDQMTNNDVENTTEKTGILFLSFSNVAYMRASVSSLLYKMRTLEIGQSGMGNTETLTLT